MASYDKSFTAVGDGPEFSVRKGDSVYYSVSGTFSATWVLMRMNHTLGWQTVATGTAASTGTVVAEYDSRFKFVCTAFTSGTMATSATEGVPGKTTRYLVNAELAKVGGTAGWLPRAANNNCAARLPAGVTAGTLVLPLPQLHVGDVITGFYPLGQIESAGNAATFDLKLVRTTLAAADLADTDMASATQVSVTADTVLNAVNGRRGDLAIRVEEDQTYYLVATGTTAASTDIALAGVVVETVEH